MKQELIKRGLRNIKDALFIKELVIPLAKKHQRFNIVMFEAHRVIELLLKAIICLTGHTPKETHEIDTLVDMFSRILRGLKVPPLLAVIHLTNNNGYFVMVNDKEISVIRRNNNVYTQLGSSLSMNDLLATDKLLKLKLEVSDSRITLYSGDREIISRTDSTFPEPLQLHRDFSPAPNLARIVALKKAGKELNEHRVEAFYGIKVGSETDANKIIFMMEIALEATSCFFTESND